MAGGGSKELNAALEAKVWAEVCGRGTSVSAMGDRGM